MKTLNENYKNNINIMIENLKRGLTKTQADSIIEHFKSQFMENNTYNQEEKDNQDF